MSLSQILAACVFAFVVAQLATLTTTIYLHRGLSHRALTLAPSAALAARTFLWITTGMKAREWAAVHRKHHAATDTEEDPHSPAVHGFWRVQLGNVGLYKNAAKNELTLQKYAKDLPPDRLDALLFDHAALGLAIGTGLSVLIMTLLRFGWQAGLLAAGLHAICYVMISGAVNAVGHVKGKRPYDNSATNLQSLAFVSLGEGLHNNHHAAPTSARFALHPGEIDFGWWTIKLLVALHLATVRHDDVKLKRVA